MSAATFFHNELPWGENYGLRNLSNVTGCEKAAKECRKDAETLTFYATTALVSSVVAAAFASFLLVVLNPAYLLIGGISASLLIAGVITRGFAEYTNKIALKVDLYSETLFDPIGRSIAFTKKYWKPVLGALITLEGISIISHVIKKHA